MHHDLLNSSRKSLVAILIRLCCCSFSKMILTNIAAIKMPQTSINAFLPTFREVRNGILDPREVHFCRQDWTYAPREKATRIGERYLDRPEEGMVMATRGNHPHREEGIQGMARSASPTLRMPLLGAKSTHHRPYESILMRVKKSIIEQRKRQYTGLWSTNVCTCLI